MFIMIIFLKEEHEIFGLKLAKTENILTLTLESLSSLRVNIEGLDETSSKTF